MKTNKNKHRSLNVVINIDKIKKNEIQIKTDLYNYQWMGWNMNECYI